MEKSGDINVAPPRRNSAKKAVAAFADQFSGSDSGGSSDEMGSAKWNGRASAKFKYGKKASGRKRSISVKESTTSKLGGSRAKKNTQDTPSTGPVAVASNSTEPLPPRPRPRPRPKPKKPAVEEAVPAPVTHKEVDDDGNDDALSSDLTSLSPSESERRSSSPELILVNDIHTIPTQPNPPHAISLATQLAVTSNPSKKPRNEPLWSLSGLGTYVWVLIEPKSWRVFNENEDGEDGKERVWWPGKITSSQVSEIPLQVKLFGAAGGDARIPNPCSGNILSKYDRNFRLRFQTPTFVFPKPLSELDDILASARKKQKRDHGDIERTWEAAVANMRLDAGEVTAGSDSSEDFPEVGDMFKHLTTPAPASSLSQFISAPSKLNSLASGRANRTGKRRQRSSASDDGRRIALMVEDEEDAWKPPPPHDEMDIPGELVLARDKAATTVSYWPGQLVAYIPPATRKQQAKYTVMWLDGKTQDIPRSWFYRMEDDGFAACKLGEFTSEVLEVQNDEDDDDNDNVPQRSPSPDPLSPPPSMEDFLELSIREQFVYTKPILKAILMHEYEPVHDKHRRFINGGKQRQNIAAEAALRGKMDPKHVELLQSYIEEWCLRDERRVAKGIEDSVHVDEAVAEEVRVADRTDEDLGLRAMERQASPLHVQRLVSPPMTEAMPASSPPAIPPSSSLPSSKIGREGSVLSSTSSFPSLTQASMSDIETHSIAAIEPLTIDDINDDTSDLTNMDDEQSIAESRPPRQRGCDDFESLPPVTKIEYCSNILLLEAIRQILLWRTGARTSAKLLSPQEERCLYDKGEELLRETEWVFDIMRFRKLKQSLMENRALKKSGSRNSLGRTASEGRMRRQVNYAE